MEISSWLTDVHGPRLTGSPNIQKAGEWAAAKMKEWGLQNVALEPWADRGTFAHGWTNDKFYMAAVSPQAFPIPGTPTLDARHQRAGPRRGRARHRDDAGGSEETRGQAEGQVDPDAGGARRAGVLESAGDARDRRRTAADGARRRSPAPEFGVPESQRGRTRRRRRTRRLRQAAPLQSQRVVQDRRGRRPALDRAARPRHLHIGGGDRTADPAAGLPRITIPAEQYGRLARMVAKSIPVTIEADIKNTYIPNPPMFNVVGEIRGTDKADEVVMLGAHFDSWHASTGATDNVAGSAAMMEAMRILKQSGVTLRRTVRIGLWTGEEQGLIGSRDYVTRAFGGCNDPVGGRGGQRGGAGRAAAPAATAGRAGRRRRPPAQRSAAADAAAARPATRSSRSTRSSPATSTSTTAPARSAASTCSRTTPSGRSSASGWSRSAASA